MAEGLKIANQIHSELKKDMASQGKDYLTILQVILLLDDPENVWLWNRLKEYVDMGVKITMSIKDSCIT